MVGWAFSLAMAGNFPALVMGVWWKRATATGAVCGIIAGFGLCLFYLVTTRYFPAFGVKYFGMTSLLNPVTGAPLVDIAKAMALPNAMESFPTLAHPLANKVGWFDLTNIACGLLGAPLGFAVIYIVSQLGKEPSRGNAGLCRRYPASREAGRCSRRRRPRRLLKIGNRQTGPFIRAPSLFVAPYPPCPDVALLPLLAWNGGFGGQFVPYEAVTPRGENAVGYRELVRGLLVLPSA